MGKRTERESGEAWERSLMRSESSEGFGYYTRIDPSLSEINQSNIESKERPLVVNCAGIFAGELAFTTDKRGGRLDYQLIYVSEGRLTFFHEGTSAEAGAGSVILLPPRVPYRFTHRGGERIRYFWVHFTGGEVEERLSEYELHTLPRIYDTTSGTHISQRFQGLFDAFSRRHAHLDRELSALLDCLLIAVSRGVAEGNEGVGILSRSLHYLTANYSKRIHIPDLAEMEHLSVSRYNDLFKRQMGLPPTRYILELRMSSAKELLGSTDLPVKQIGSMCGYDDPHFFSKTFRAYQGVSPVEYRRGAGTNIKQ